MRKQIRGIARRLLSQRAMNRLQHAYLHAKCGASPYWLRLKSPKTFNEKIIWLKLNYRHPQAALFADKLAVREEVRRRVGENVLARLLGSWERAEDIKFTDLPAAYVLKSNHASGQTAVIADSTQIDVEALRRRAAGWLAVDYGREGGEYQYSMISPKIIAEEHLGRGGDPPADFKFFCFGGHPRLVQVDLDRFGSHRRAYFDPSWMQLPFTVFYPRFEGELPAPPHFERMLEIARLLSAGSPFLRVDLYGLPDGPRFGELTLHPNGGFEPFLPAEWDARIGEFIQLPAANA